MSTTFGKTSLAYSRAWHLVDVAQDPRSMGRLASSIAITLMGKHKPIYNPSTDCGDYVVVTNCRALYVTGNKLTQKMYYRHSSRPGSLKTLSMERMISKWGAGEVLKKAVRGMLPKNKLRDRMMERLKTFEGSKHDYEENIVKYNCAPKKLQIEGSPILERIAKLKEAQAAAATSS